MISSFADSIPLFDLAPILLKTKTCLQHWWCFSGSMGYFYRIDTQRLDLFSGQVSVCLPPNRAATAFGSRVVGIVLTGMDGDGMAGLQAVKQAGGIMIIQDPTEAA